jgi:hypothetical protein
VRIAVWHPSPRRTETPVALLPSDAALVDCEETTMKHRPSRWFFAGLGIAVVAAIVGFAVAGTRRRSTGELFVDTEPSVPLTEPEPQPVP